MKRVGLTQRVEVIPSYGERRDCLDQNWTKLLGEAGFVPVPLCNTVDDVGAYLESLAVDALVLTGGNDVASVEGAVNPAPERDRFELEAMEVCAARRIPIVGVCRGMQMLNLSNGGRLVRAENHVARRHEVSFRGERFEVNSYHGFVVPSDGLGPEIEALGFADDGTVEAIRHAGGRAHGMMWHPERETPFRKRDIDLLRELLEAPS